MPREGQEDDRTCTKIPACPFRDDEVTKAESEVEVVMLGTQPADPNYDARVRGSFGRQKIMQMIGAVLARVAPGEVEIELPFRDDLTQQHGYLHGGVITAIADSACGYAALTLLPAGAEVLTVEYKVNFLAPARGTRLVARGRVVRSGQTISVCEGEVRAEGEHTDVRIAAMLATMIRADTQARSR